MICSDVLGSSRPSPRSSSRSTKTSRTGRSKRSPSTPKDVRAGEFPNRNIPTRWLEGELPKLERMLKGRLRGEKERMKTACVCHGLPPLDQVLQGIRLGDNVVWQVDRLEDYALFAEPFARQAIRTGGGRSISVSHPTRLSCRRSTASPRSR